MKIKLCRKLVWGAIFIMVINSCSGDKPDTIGIKNNQLSECPNSPNCVSTNASNTEHQIEPFNLKPDFDTNWKKAIKVVKGVPRTTIITESNNYLHVEFKSLFFRFIDDLELLLNRENGTIAIRSASRIGYSDFGANRKRVASLRSLLNKDGIIK